MPATTKGLEVMTVCTPSMFYARLDDKFSMITTAGWKSAGGDLAYTSGRVVVPNECLPDSLRECQSKALQDRNYDFVLKPIDTNDHHKDEFQDRSYLYLAAMGLGWGRPGERFAEPSIFRLRNFTRSTLEITSDFWVYSIESDEQLMTLHDRLNEGKLAFKITKVISP